MLTTLAISLLLAAADPSVLKGYDPKGGFGRTIYELEISGILDAEVAASVEKLVADAGERDVILVRLNTFGGRVDAAARARDALLASRAATVALIDSHALSAGTLVALACQTVLMTPAATIGAATPMPLADDGNAQPPSEKALSIMRAELRGTAEARGRPTAVVEAMVDPSLGLQGVAAPGQVVTLTTSQALALGIADAEVVGREAAVALLNLEDATRVERQATTVAVLRRYLDRPRIVAILMFFGLLGLVVALRRDHGLARKAAATFAAMVGAFTLGHLKFRTPSGYLVDLTGLGLYAMAVVVAVVGVYLVVWVLPPGAWLRRLVARGRRD